MGDNTKISWTDATWNVVTGCFPKSPGCANCYAAKLAAGRLRNQPAYAGLTTNGGFNGTVRFHADRLLQPIRWKRPRAIFVNAMGDLFHPGVDNQERAAVFAAMMEAPHHNFQILTKYVEEAAAFFEWLEAEAECNDMEADWVERELSGASDSEAEETCRKMRAWFHCKPLVDALNLETDGDYEVDTWSDGRKWEWPLPNVCFGVSVESQKYWDERVDLLHRKIPAAVKFVSMEPMLETINPHGAERVDLIIVGGESGPKARKFDVEWGLDIIVYCNDLKNPRPDVQIKQLGSNVVATQDCRRCGNAGELHTQTKRGLTIRVCPSCDGVAEPEPLRLRNPKGADPTEWPETLRPWAAMPEVFKPRAR